jgi:hypothetical protein
MDNRRIWLSIVLEEGLNLGILTPEDILRHATPAIIATDLPPTIVASLIQAGLDSGAFSPDLLVGHLGPKTLAEHMPVPVLWACINEMAEEIVATHPLSQGEAGALDLQPAVVDHQGPDIEVIEES